LEAYTTFALSAAKIDQNRNPFLVAVLISRLGKNIPVELPLTAGRWTLRLQPTCSSVLSAAVEGCTGIGIFGGGRLALSTGAKSNLL
jgi:hypothetical protein